jgi:tetratricopeptide (TPR) repeat protein
MDPNPYQSPAPEPPPSYKRSIDSRPSMVALEWVLAYFAAAWLVITIVAAVWFVAGPGAGLASIVAFATVVLSCIVWRTSVALRWVSIAAGAALILAFGIEFEVPWLITAACLALSCGISIGRLFFPKLAELNLIGLKLHERGKLEAAHACFDRVLRRDPRHYDALVNRGVTRERLHRLDEAVADLSAAISIRPDLTLAYAHRGRIQVLRKAWDEAIVDLRKGLSGDPENLDIRYWLGCAYAQRGSFDEALVEADHLMCDVRLRPHGFVIRAIALERHGDHVAAISEYEAAVSLDPNTHDAWNQIGILSAGSNNAAARDGPRAIAAATRACELSKWQNWISISVLAAAYAESGQFDEAVRWAKEALRLAPPEEKATREQRVAQYEQGEPYRLPS